ncbi:SDR family NAD(P)-dependent oxidoreductase [Jatrophihabitans sp. DSM 44399]|uniref:SDR family NAD(P)-dependent oxidoreductase n=1 Tax=Jatrophihabitans lederbergiae TaxID=3075547 RepID=A0ABU2J926_9ACTN|nr:SDR family NAD(P)-dependent oxidoreductase [Jatrophihabitans sp. DSM 44399]MDT0261491.1 SDR family NAD(P)-dependent oxidoreductase [Jatrophihabitans sp. DSM 44399]
MRDQQRPLGSGFTAASTADDVLAGVDLAGVNAIVTGGHSGIGLAATRPLARAGASVTVPARNPDRAAQNLSGINRVEVHRMDLLDPDTINAFADAWNTTSRPLHILVNNAAVPTPDSVVRDSRGFEVQFATSHLGHFQLTLALHDALRAAHGARVVNVSSGAHRFAGIRWDDPNFTKTYDPGLSYAQAKTANVLFAFARWTRRTTTRRSPGSRVPPCTTCSSAPAAWANSCGSDCALVGSKLGIVARRARPMAGALPQHRTARPMPLDSHGRGTTPLRRASNSRSKRARWSSITALGASSAMRRRAVSTITVP